MGNDERAGVQQKAQTMTTEEMRILLEKVGPCLDDGNTAPLENLLFGIIEWIEKNGHGKREQRPQGTKLVGESFVFRSDWTK